MRDILLICLILFVLFVLGAFFGRTMVRGSTSSDTIVIKTDSCHFYMDSAFYTIDEMRIEYSK